MAILSFGMALLLTLVPRWICYLDNSLELLVLPLESILFCTDIVGLNASLIWGLTMLSETMVYALGGPLMAGFETKGLFVFFGSSLE